jgi:hypothetical protein
MLLGATLAQKKEKAAPKDRYPLAADGESAAGTTRGRFSDAPRA